MARDGGNPFTMVDATSENNRMIVPPIQHQLADDSDNNEEKKSKERRWALALFSVTTLLLFADQNLMSPNLTGKNLPPRRHAIYNHGSKPNQVRKLWLRLFFISWIVSRTKTLSLTSAIPRYCQPLGNKVFSSILDHRPKQSPKIWDLARKNEIAS